VRNIKNTNVQMYITKFKMTVSCANYHYHYGKQTNRFFQSRSMIVANLNML